MQVNKVLTDDQVRRLVGVVFVAICSHQIYDRLNKKKRTADEEKKYAKLMCSVQVRI
jgi:hypothetical protein